MLSASGLSLSQCGFFTASSEYSHNMSLTTPDMVYGFAIMKAMSGRKTKYLSQEKWWNKKRCQTCKEIKPLIGFRWISRKVKRHGGREKLCRTCEAGMVK